MPTYTVHVILYIGVSIHFQFQFISLSTATINVGRIAALLAYCYHLCKKYIQQNYAAGGLISFLMMVGGWLFKFLLKAKFYEWLEKQGGWVSQ